MGSERFFLATDNSGHWYIVPASKRRAWEKWADLDEDDERSWESPKFAQAVGGSYTLVTFENPKVR